MLLLPLPPPPPLPPLPPPSSVVRGRRLCTCSHSFLTATRGCGGRALQQSVRPKQIRRPKKPKIHHFGGCSRKKNCASSDRRHHCLFHLYLLKLPTSAAGSSGSLSSTSLPQNLESKFKRFMEKSCKRTNNYFTLSTSLGATRRTCRWRSS